MQRDAASTRRARRTPALGTTIHAGSSTARIASALIGAQPLAHHHLHSPRHRVSFEPAAVLVLGHVVAPRTQANDHQVTMPTYLTSRYSSMPSRPPSRPYPDALTPPKGAAGLRRCRCSAPPSRTRCPRRHAVPGPDRSCRRTPPARTPCRSPPRSPRRPSRTSRLEPPVRTLPHAGCATPDRHL